MERVVYILGAGFSAPLGVPVVRDFLFRAKDLYFTDSAKYGHFEPIFEAITELARVKNYLHSDLYDIEEIFSIIEMRRQLGVAAPDFAKFISDVVQASTPEMPNPLPMHGQNMMWGGHEMWRRYGSFALALARLRLLNSNNPYECEEIVTPYHYDVITLNYDRAIEIPLTRVGDRSPIGGGLFHRPSTSSTRPANARLSIFKLHGDAYDGSVVPPTWDKSVRAGAKTEWAAAHFTLSKANHVRVLGYSFPPTDTYFRYFLKASLSQTTHLKTLDILTRDSDGEVQRRCEATFAFKFMRFREFEAGDYLDTVAFGDLERTHEAYR